MPRKSAASLSIATPVRVPGKLVAPADMTPRAKAIFGRIVADLSAEHFTDSDVGMLRQFCVAQAMAEQAEAALAAEGPIVAGRANPWLIVQEKAHRAMATLGLKLRLCPHSRLDRSKVTAQRTRPQIDWARAVRGEDCE